jgi:hypothetical protein
VIAQLWARVKESVGWMAGGIIVFLFFRNRQLEQEKREAQLEAKAAREDGESALEKREIAEIREKADAASQRFREHAARYDAKHPSRRQDGGGE